MSSPRGPHLTLAETTLRRSNHIFSAKTKLIDAEITKTGSKDTLRWPAFRTEQLAQDWWNPADYMGRIKVTVAEGYIEGGPFIRIRNLVTFSFQHAPLSEIQLLNYLPILT